MHSRLGRPLTSATGLLLAALLLTGCGGGDEPAGDAGGSGGSGTSEGSGAEEGAAGGGDKELCGDATTEWSAGLRAVAQANAEDGAGFTAALTQAQEDTQALADQAQDPQLKAAFEGVVDDLATFQSDVESGAIDRTNAMMTLRAGADAVAGQADVGQACLDLGAA